MPGASVGDPYCRQYRIYGQSAPLGAAEPLVDFYGEHRWRLWCPGWVALGSTQFRWRVFAWTFNALNRTNERVFVLEARGRLVWLLLSLRSKGLLAYALKGHWRLLLLILGDLEENKALCLSLSPSSCLTPLDFDWRRILEWSPVLVPGFLASSQYRPMRLWVGTHVYRAQLFQTQEAAHALSAAVYWDSILVLVVSGFSGWNLHHLDASWF